MLSGGGVKLNCVIVFVDNISQCCVCSASSASVNYIIILAALYTCLFNRLRSRVCTRAGTLDWFVHVHSALSWLARCTARCMWCTSRGSWQLLCVHTQCFSSMLRCVCGLHCMRGQLHTAIHNTCAAQQGKTATFCVTSLASSGLALWSDGWLFLHLIFC